LVAARVKIEGLLDEDEIKSVCNAHIRLRYLHLIVAPHFSSTDDYL